jgi:hypothetical protein
MLARRLATIAALLGLVAALIAPFRVNQVFVANSGHGPGLLGLWMMLPIVLGALAIAAVRTASIGFVWAIVGAVWGFMILGAWSLGLFFAWEALALLVAGILHLIAVGARWRLLLVPLWLIAGAAALCPILFAVDLIRQERSQGYMTVTHAPAIVYGSWLWAAAVALLCTIELISRAIPHTARAGDRA